MINVANGPWKKPSILIVFSLVCAVAVEVPPIPGSFPRASAISPSVSAMRASTSIICRDTYKYKKLFSAIRSPNYIRIKDRMETYT